MTSSYFNGSQLYPDWVTSHPNSVTQHPNSVTQHPEFVTAYLECVNTISASLNVSLDTQIWLSALASQSNSTGLQYEGYTATPSSEEGAEVVGMVAGYCLNPPQHLPRPYLLPWWQQMLWAVAFGTMLCAAICGNALVMWIVCAHKRMRTVTNYFLMNLSAADLLMSLLNCMFNFIYMLHSDWPFGAAYCTFSNTVANVTIAASVFTLMAISFDRYIAIVRPLEPRMSKTLARIFIVAIWVSSGALALPCALFSTTVTVRYMEDEVRRGCILQWPDGHTSASQQEHVYNIVFFITTYLVPMLVMFTSYTLISIELWGSKHIGELSERQVNIIRSKRRVVRMFIVIVVIFALCWLPQQAFFLYQYHDNQMLDTDHVQHVYLAFYWLAMANAMVNPVVYYWMNARFRAYFKEVMTQCLCLRCAHSPHRQYTASPVLQRRMPSLDRDVSSRSRSDSRCVGNGTVRTVPTSLHYRTPHPHPSRGFRLSNKAIPDCEICLQSFQPNPLKPSPLKCNSLQPTPLKSSPLQPDIPQPNPLQPNPLQPNPLQPNPLQPNPLQPNPLQPNSLQPNPLQQNPLQPNSLQSNPLQTKPPLQPSPSGGPPLTSIPDGGEDPMTPLQPPTEGERPPSPGGGGAPEGEALSLLGNGRPEGGAW